MSIAVQHGNAISILGSVGYQCCVWTWPFLGFFLLCICVHFHLYLCPFSCPIQLIITNFSPPMVFIFLLHWLRILYTCIEVASYTGFHLKCCIANSPGKCFLCLHIWWNQAMVECHKKNKALKKQWSIITFNLIISCVIS